MMLQWPQARKTGNMQRKKLDGRGIAPDSEPLTKIHALRKERDVEEPCSHHHQRNFNPHAPQERDHSFEQYFLLPLDFNPRAPQERDPLLADQRQDSVISIHALRKSATLYILP